MKNIDKIAIGIAILVLLIGSSVPLLSGDGEDPRKRLETAQAILLSKSATGAEEAPTLATPDLAALVSSTFAPTPRPGFEPWNCYRRPGRIFVKEPEKTDPAVHTASRVRRAAVEREIVATKKLTRHSVTWTLGDIKNATLKRASLQVQEVGGADWRNVTTIEKGTSGQEFTTLVDSLDAGKEYSYRVVTEVEPASKAAGAAGFIAKIESDPSKPLLLPFDELFDLTSVTLASVSAGQLNPGRCAVTRHWWNWEKGKLEKTTDANVIEVGEDEWKNGKFICNSRYKLRRIVGSLDKPKEHKVLLADPTEPTQKLELVRSETRVIPAQIAPPPIEVVDPPPAEELKTEDK